MVWWSLWDIPLWCCSPVLDCISVVRASDWYVEDHMLESYSGLSIFFLIIPSKFFQFSDQIIPIIYYLGVADWSSIRVTGETLHANSVHFLVYSRENLGKVDSILWCNQQSFTLTFSILGFITGKTGNLLGFDTFLDWHLSKTLPPLLRYQGYFFFIYQC